jgi:dephospho-CoA kinase
MTLRIGLTGGIGSGKTTVAKIFELLNVPVYYADEASKNLYHTDKNLIQRMKEHFGDSIYTDGRLNRSQLAAIVFENKKKLELLNSLVHPATIAHAEEWMGGQKAPYTIKEAALIFESGSAGSLDYVIGVQAPEYLRISRAMERDRSGGEAIIARMNSQIDEKIKMRLCDFLINNDEKHLLIPQVIKLHEHLLTLAKNKSEVEN